jgi:hypothetical protein
MEAERRFVCDAPAQTVVLLAICFESTPACLGTLFELFRSKKRVGSGLSRRDSETSPVDRLRQLSKTLCLFTQVINYRRQS